MVKLALVRVDARLIHGQIAAKWSKYLNVNRIILIDDDTAGDAFMKRFFELASVPGVKTTIFSIEEAVASWKQDGFGEGKALVIFKTVDAAKQAFDLGFCYDALDLGQVPGGVEDRVVISGSVNLNTSEINLLRELKQNGVEVFFQGLPQPEDKPVELDAALKKVKL